MREDWCWSSQGREADEELRFKFGTACAAKGCSVCLGMNLNFRKLSKNSGTGNKGSAADKG